MFFGWFSFLTWCSLFSTWCAVPPDTPFMLMLILDVLLIVRLWPNGKLGYFRYFSTLTQNFKTKIQNWAGMDGTIRFPLLLSIGINCYFLLSDRLLIHHHALKWKVLNQIFLLLSGPPPKHTKRQRRNSARQMKKNGREQNWECPN